MMNFLLRVTLRLGVVLLLLYSQTMGAAPAVEKVFFPEKLLEMDLAIEKAISSNRTPGAVLWIERNGASYRKSYGSRAVVPSREAMTLDTIFDAASLTKVVATTPAIMLLVQKGKIDLDAPVQKYLPEFGANGKEKITIRQLMTHTSGLRPGIANEPKWEGQAAAIEKAAAEKPVTAPNEAFRYSDINFFVLGEVIQRVSGKKLERFVEDEIYRPLKMRDTGYSPAPHLMKRIAPTTATAEQLTRGAVHDPTARAMGGVAGHAGLFTTAADLARYARMLLNEGTLDGKRIFKPETVRLMTSLQTPANITARRGLGWDLDSPYAGPRGKHFPVGSYGHTGWTGTSLWIDPFSDTFVILMSNRNHPDENGNVIGLRNVLGTLAAEAVRDFNYAYVPGALPARTQEIAVPRRSVSTTQVLNGIDVLAKQQFKPLKGLRVGLITNHTGHDRERNPTIDLLHQAPDVKLVGLFSPEHGIRGALDENVKDSTDEKTGLPVYSLYGVRRTPAPEQLADIDALVFDIQDIGCRFYTYISTMGNCMEAAAKAKVKYFVLDRVNPITGTMIEGSISQSATNSFTAYHKIPVRHGMTVGELARMFNAERNFKADLQVIELQGWQRDQWFDQTGLPWTNPSPNMRSLTEATLYPGIGLLETTAVSVGRGTDIPFEVVGAPYIDDLQLAAELNKLGYEGVRFVPIRFTPNASVFKGQPCRGVNIVLTDRENVKIVEVGIAMAKTLLRLYPNDYKIEKFNNLLVYPPIIAALKAGKSVDEMKRAWEPELSEFKTRREKFLIYK